jgi:hypothetical protein
VRSRAWFGLILGATALIAARPVRGQEGPGSEPPAGPARGRDPIDLAAHRVIVWSRDGYQYVLLAGKAAVVQGDEVIRAEQVVVRLRKTPTEAGTSYRLDLFAEGLVPVAGRPTNGPVQRTLRTEESVRLKSYDPRGPITRDGPPTRGYPIVAHAGLLDDLQPSATAPTLLPRKPTATPQPLPTVALQPVPAPAQPVAGAGLVTTVPAPAAPTAGDTPSTTPDVVVLPDLPPAEVPGPSTARGARRVAATGRPAKIDPEVTRAGFGGGPADPPADAPGVVGNELPPAFVSQVPRRDGAPAGARGAVLDELPPAFESQVPRLADSPAGAGAPVGDELPPVVESQLPPRIEAPELETAPTVPELPEPPPRNRPPTELAPLPAFGDETVPAPPTRRPPRAPADGATEAEKNPMLPIHPGTQRVTRIAPRDGSPNFQYQRLPVVNGMDTVVVRGGVNVLTQSPQFGELDISADSAIIWRRIDENGQGVTTGPNGEEIEDARQPMEIYLEGHVVVRQDQRKIAGTADQKTYRADRVYMDVLTNRSIALDGQVDLYAPSLVAPMKVISPRIEQYQPLELAANGKWVYGLEQIRAEQTMTTGSRFPKPGYRFNSRSVDMTRVRTDNKVEPNSGKPVGDKSDPNAPEDLTWRIDARQNVFWMGAVPVFYWPRFVANADDLEPALRQFGFSTNNYFGQMVKADFNGFRLLEIQRPNMVDLWNVDLDYLSARTKRFPALGSEIGWFGTDLLNDLADPYGKVKGEPDSITRDYFGYFDIWGLWDSGRDILGSGPAIITNNIKAGKAGFQRGGGGLLGSVPPFQDPRGRFNIRHMQRFLPDDEEHVYQDLRVQLEVGTYSDRYFLEEYYKRLFDTGMDQETLLYAIRQKENWAYSIWTEANLQSWQTETQWLPRLDYYRLGDSLLDNWFTYFQHSGVDYANTHTASEVNNPNIFAFMPYDPISNTSGVLKAGRGYTNHEIDLKLNTGSIFRLVPYLQGQAVGWTNQIDGQSLGRVWGAVGARAEVMAWKAYPWVQSELFNVHGLNHKINFEADFRDAFSNVPLDRIGVQDDLDDNTYESVRRYLALTNYAGGILPPQYDPRHLILRRAISPITGTTDIQAAVETLHLGIHQRLQTKRGPEGRRRIIDYMTLDLDTTYFPAASRDNFGKPFGQNTYNWQWFIGDRTSIMSYGWFEFFNITGNPIYKTNFTRHNDPFGLNMITSGISLNRPPRGSVFIGYSIVDTGPINTSALTTSVSYWLSPKWYGTYSTMYDFGNGILLSAMGSLTRIGADYLTSIGLTVDPQRQSYMFAFQIAPRISPNMRFGSGVGMGQFDPRYAPTQ